MTLTYLTRNLPGGSVLVFVFVCLLLVMACKDTSSSTETGNVTELESRFETVRAIHDEVMPRRGELIRSQRKIARDASLSLEVRTLADTRLQRADDAMMNWMYADVPYAKLRDSLNDQQLDTYLTEREQAIRAVADSMNATIDFAQQLLERQ